MPDRREPATVRRVSILYFTSMGISSCIYVVAFPTRPHRPREPATLVLFSAPSWAGHAAVSLRVHFYQEAMIVGTLRPSEWCHERGLEYCLLTDMESAFCWLGDWCSCEVTLGLRGMICVFHNLAVAPCLRAVLVDLRNCLDIIWKLGSRRMNRLLAKLFGSSGPIALIDEHLVTRLQHLHLLSTFSHLHKTYTGRAEHLGGRLAHLPLR